MIQLQLTHIYGIIAGILLITNIACGEPQEDSAGAVRPTVALESATKVVPVTDRFQSFSPLQKKYLKTVIVTNILYASGLSLYCGVVLPRSRKVDDMMGALKLMPLNILSGAMMYSSLPMSVVSSYKASHNYQHFYKDSPYNFTKPLLLCGALLYAGSFSFSCFQMYKDYRDNKELDQSYKKYNDAANGLLNAGGIVWAGTNLYSLVYIIALGKMAEKNRSPSTTAIITPLIIGDAAGAQISLEF